MGTSVDVIVVEGDAEPALAELDRLERCWSRFLPTSDLSRCNAAAGSVTVVSADLLVLVQHLLAARRATAGRFDPTLGVTISELGYDVGFDRLDQDDPTPLSVGAPPEERSIDVWPAASAVRIPRGVRLDPGGLGKGLAADVVADRAMADGALGVLVDLGGDIVVRGVAPDGGPWRIEVPGSVDRPDSVVELHDGAVATSDTTVRRWRRGGRSIGHVLDPLDGRPVERQLRATVVAGSGWWAEAAATGALVSTARGDGWVDELATSGSVARVWVDDLEGGGR